MVLLLNYVKASEVNFSHVMITAVCDQHDRAVTCVFCRLVFT